MTTTCRKQPKDQRVICFWNPWQRYIYGWRACNDSGGPNSKTHQPTGYLSWRRLRRKQTHIPQLFFLCHKRFDTRRRQTTPDVVGPSTLPHKHNGIRPAKSKMAPIVTIITSWLPCFGYLPLMGSVRQTNTHPFQGGMDEYETKNNKW